MVGFCSVCLFLLSRRIAKLFVSLEETLKSDYHVRRQTTHSSLTSLYHFLFVMKVLQAEERPHSCK